MADFIQVGSETEVILYGAGQMAHRFYDSIQKERISIIACLDQNAKDKKPVGNIPVLLPDDPVITESQKQNALVILTQIDVYTHPAIAEFLNAQGYRFILYLGALDAEKKDAHFIDLNAAYNRLRYEGKISGSIIPRYKKEVPTAARTAVLRRDRCGDITAFVPLHLLFSARKDTCFHEKAIPNAVKPFWDRSVWEYLFAFPIFDFFENGLSGNWEEELECYRAFSQYDANAFGTFDSVRHFEHTLASRYHIYQNMCQMFYSNRKYFYDFPPRVKWNRGGYFNIEDGNNRVAFLMCKKQFITPCQMSERDYEQWLNSGQMSLFENACKPFPDFSLSSCFPHPAFFPFPRFEKDIYLQTVCTLLGRHNYSLSNKRLLCLERIPSYLPHHFYKMGADITLVVGEFYDIARSMKGLFHTPKMNVLREGEFQKHILENTDIILISDSWSEEFLSERGIRSYDAVTFWRKAVVLEPGCGKNASDRIFYAENGPFAITALNLE